MTNLIVIGGVVVAVLGLLVWFFVKIKKAGRVEAENKANKRSAKHAREANEIDEDVARMSPAKRKRERLRYTRPE